MQKKQMSVKQLAAEAKIDSDEALIRLWDSGIEKITTASDKLRGEELKLAKKVLNITSPRELVNPRHWELKFGLTSQEFAVLLEKLSITINPAATSLPKGAIGKLKIEFNKRATEHMLSRVEARDGKVSPTVEEGALRPKPISIAPAWRIVGHKQNNIRWLNSHEVLRIHEALVVDFANSNDPIIPAGCSKMDLLESALFRPQTSNVGELKYPTIEMAAAALLHSMIFNHPFHNGNKRTGLVTMLSFLSENGFVPTCNEDELFKFVLQVAMRHLVEPNLRGVSDYETLGIAEWIYRNARPLERGTRPIVFRRLSQVLNAYGCKIESVGKSGGRKNISRTIKLKGFFGRSKETKLHSQIAFAGEGREVERNTINKIRVDLQLDEEHGVDGRAFYEDADFTIDYFIANYSRTLKRLSRL